MKKGLIATALLFVILVSFTGRTVEKSTIGQPKSEKVRIEKLSIEDRGKVNAPAVVIYKTKYNKATEVTFDHKIHAESYGLKCIECHHVEKCAHCHGSDTASMMVEEAKIALHETCMGCHRMIESGPRKCDDCHKKSK